jgi:hypothetical protein
MIKLLRNVGAALCRATIWICALLLSVELLAFAGISISNYLVYGHFKEGSRIKYDPYVFFLNEHGGRPTRNNPPDDTGRPVWMFGGSTMRGATNDDAQTIPSHLAGEMNRDSPGLRFVNLGENSFNSLLEVKMFQRCSILEPEIPAAVIFYDGANDSTYFSQYQTVNAHFGLRRMRGLIESYHGSLFGLFKGLNAGIRASSTYEAYEKIRFTLEPLSPDNPVLHDFVNAVEQRYDYMARECLYRGADFVLFWQPTRWTESTTPGEADALAVFRANIQLVYSRLEERLSSKPYFLSLRGVLLGQEGVYAPDGVHLTDKGRHVVAMAMAKQLRTRPGIFRAERTP